MCVRPYCWRTCISVLCRRARACFRGFFCLEGGRRVVAFTPKAWWLVVATEHHLAQNWMGLGNQGHPFAALPVSLLVLEAVGMHG
jgi:hypothetical protein